MGNVRQNLFFAFVGELAGDLGHLFGKLFGRLIIFALAR